ncbi:AfsR/SARP family transcriptional regulator [Nocardiopsis sp. CNT-189]|uniref:AfsR/SARP family transcriptional regulator n=1 Tax=Nocardiopsis oceanisediminis TaxID=2816862 RepID=UPI003B38575C
MAEISFDVLGPLTVQEGGTPLVVRGDKRRSLLAALLLRCGRTVPGRDLVRIMWGPGIEEERRRGALQVHVVRLRAALGFEYGGRLVTGGDGGYRVELSEDQLDLLRLRRTTGEADRAERDGDPQRSFRLLHRALRMWKGPVAADARSPELYESDVRHVEDELLGTAERWGALGLRLGRHDAVLDLLGLVAARFPERERLVRTQMVALYRGGRQGDALQLFARTRRRLADRLGVDPGPELRRTFEGILRGDLGEGPGVPRQRAAPLLGGAGRTGPPVPAQLPAGVPGFVGRRAELAELDARIGPDARGRAGRVLLSGPPGAGCSALALHWAHRAAERFPGGSLHADLGGGPDPQEVAGRFLRALGVSGPLPESLEECSALLRTALAGQRVLMLLDGARDAAAVRPLLPGAAGCGVLVTSRYWLGDLLARDGAAAVAVGALPREEAVRLLRGRLGEARVDAEPEGAARLAAAVRGMPLPLSMAAAWMSTHPGAGLDDLASRVEARDEEAPAERMAAVLGGDPRFLIGGPGADGSGGGARQG